MRHRALPVLLLLTAAAPPRGALVLPADAPFVAATLNDVPVRLRVSFDAPGLVALTPAAAARIGFPRVGDGTVTVGPIRLPARSAAGLLRIGDGRAVVRAIWVDAPPTRDGAEVDGIVSPALLPAATVRIERPLASGRRTSMPVRVRAVDGLSGTLPGTAVELRLAPERPETIATAAAAAALLARQDGRLDPDPAGGRRFIGYGVSRPVRRLTLRQPLRVPGGTLDRLLVRTADGGARPAASQPASPDEVVVTAGSGPPRLTLTLGADLLGRCRAITWVARAARVDLDCPAVAAARRTP